MPVNFSVVTGKAGCFRVAFRIPFVIRRTSVPHYLQYNVLPYIYHKCFIPYLPLMFYPILLNRYFETENGRQNYPSGRLGGSYGRHDQPLFWVKNG